MMKCEKSKTVHLRKLKACPYCGGEAIFSELTPAIYPTARGALVGVICENCGAKSARVPVLLVGKNTVKSGFETLDAVIAAWNRES